MTRIAVHLFFAAALSSILGQQRHHARAFTHPAGRLGIVHSGARGRSPGEIFVSSGHGRIHLYAAKAGEVAAAGVVDAPPPASAQNGPTQAVVDTTGMPMPVSIGDDAVAKPVGGEDDGDAIQSYRRGLATILFITLLFASNSPALRSAFDMTSSSPPVLLINAAVSVVGLTGVTLASPFLTKVVPDPSKSASAILPEAGDTASDPNSNLITRVMGPSTIAGAELGLWKTLGTAANIYGLSQTSSDHGAFLIQLTTLIVPAAQGLSGVPIPTRIWTAIGLALGGVFMFTQDPTQSDCASLQGDLLCALAAIFYATYDLRLFKWGKVVPTDELITTKMVTQSLLSFGLLSVLGREETLDYLSQASTHDLQLVGTIALWSGLAVNCLAPYLQVWGQQAVGPARAQILYASQPLWAAIMSFFLLGEQFGAEGLIGGSLFIGAMFLAATAETPDPNCPAVECEV